MPAEMVFLFIRKSMPEMHIISTRSTGLSLSLWLKVINVIGPLIYTLFIYVQEGESEDFTWILNFNVKHLTESVVSMI